VQSAPRSESRIQPAEEAADDGSRIIYLCISDEQLQLLEELTATGLYGYTKEVTATEIFGRVLRRELLANGWSVTRG
jgi:hypothetical protein